MMVLHNTMENYNSVYFLSNHNDKTTSEYRIGKFIKNRIFDFDECIKHLEETERMKVVRNKDFDTFVQQHPDIYYDDDSNFRPTCDVLYRKINNNYFVKNDEYFNKITEFYFILYSAIFPSIGLKNIKLNLSNISDSNGSVNIDFNCIVAKAGLNDTTNESFNQGKRINMHFGKDQNDLNVMKAINKAGDDKVSYINKNILPLKLKKSMYLTGIHNELDLIEKRVKNKLNSFSKILEVENTNVHNVKTHITKVFNVGPEIGLLSGYSKEKYICNTVSYELDFYDLETPLRQQHQQVEKLDYELSFYTSLAPGLKGPWPIHCDQITTDVYHNVNEIEEAKNIARKLITKDPVNSIVEIVESFQFPAWTYSIKLFRIKKGETADVNIGKGRRYVAFDSKLFRDSERVVRTLKDGEFY